MKNFLSCFAISALVSFLIMNPGFGKADNNPAQGLREIALPVPEYRMPKFYWEWFLENEAEVKCLQKNIYFEARNQGTDGMLAVAFVTMNRVDHMRWPPSICAVVKQGVYENGKPVLYKCKFSWVCSGEDNPQPRLDVYLERKAWERAGELARQVLKGQHADPTGGATYYHTHEVSPNWDNVQEVARIRSHIFYARVDG